MTTLPRITDSHCHLDFPDFDDERDEVIDRAVAAGVHRMVTICTKLRQADQVRAISEAYEPVFWAAGTHPMSAAEEPLVTVEELVALAEHPKFVAIGETGLDYHYTAESKDIQQESLRIHIEAARQTKLPLIIHARAADDDMARILTEEYKAGAYTCVMHCFSSSRELAEAALELDFYLSMSGITAFPKSEDLREIFRDVPFDRILVETDSPYLAPRPIGESVTNPPMRPKPHQAAAETFWTDYAALAAQTEENFDRLFTKAARYGAATA